MLYPSPEDQMGSLAMLIQLPFSFFPPSTLFSVSRRVVSRNGTQPLLFVFRIRATIRLGKETLPVSI